MNTKTCITVLTILLALVAGCLVASAALAQCEPTPTPDCPTPVSTWTLVPPATAPHTPTGAPLEPTVVAPTETATAVPPTPAPTETAVVIVPEPPAPPETPAQSLASALTRREQPAGSTESEAPAALVLLPETGGVPLPGLVAFITGCLAVLLLATRCTRRQ